MTDEAVWERLQALKGDPDVQLSPRTQRVYGVLWNTFANWCERHGKQPLPATPATVAGFLMDYHEEGVAAGTVKTARNAIASRHKLAGLEPPTRDPGVKETLAVLALHDRRKRPASKQAVPIRAEHLKALAAKYPDPPGPALLRGDFTTAQYRQYIADRALIFTMYSALLRACEAASLRWGDIAEQEDGKGLVTIRQSKTSLTPEVVAITSSAMTYLKAHAITGGKELDPERRVFGVKTSSAIRRRIIRAMAGIREGVSGHSCRVGCAQDLTCQGVPLQAVQKMGRWKSLAMPSHYASRVDPKRGAVNALEDLIG